MNYSRNKDELENQGFSTLRGIYTDSELDAIIKCIDNANQENNSFLKTKDLFAIRQLVLQIPDLKRLVFNTKLKELLAALTNEEVFLTKAIYFDKPGHSNWFVPYHQDLSISVDQKAELKNYSNWTLKKGQYGVQPPLEILEDTITVRIHLDRADQGNGCLKVIPKSHLKGIIRTDSKSWDYDSEVFCELAQGDVMLMKPLILHGSNRTTEGTKRRVIHLEFNQQKLAHPLNWLEHQEIKQST